MNFINRGFTAVPVTEGTLKMSLFMSPTFAFKTASSPHRVLLYINTVLLIIYPSEMMSGVYLAGTFPSTACLNKSQPWKVDLWVRECAKAAFGSMVQIYLKAVNSQFGWQMFLDSSSSIKVEPYCMPSCQQLLFFLQAVFMLNVRLCRASAAFLKSP